MNKILTLPLRDEDISGLRIGDVFWLSGILVTGRDEVYHRIVEQGIAAPINLIGMANYHAGPIVKELPQETPPLFTAQAAAGKYEIVSIGPTSSIRLEKWAAGFIEKTGIKVMIGKGGMGEKTQSSCRRHKAIHCVYPGGCAVLGASQIDSIENVFWPELGMAECIWVMKTRLFGPLIVSIDTKGNNLFAENAAYYEARKKDAMAGVL
ncbi:MAG: FumA C-terminus/TtdB family hydratase beta subunit [Treponema sp.]|jgi:L(+)-tartrate dehydratase beta subunit|nr:FumA C-terminus/TtdB family hydratase beta subunit [Treponema sp.]